MEVCLKPLFFGQKDKRQKARLNKEAMGVYRVVFEFEDGSGRAPVETLASANDTVLQTAKDAGVEISTLCGGNGVCTTCHVWVTDQTHLSTCEDGEDVQVTLCENYQPHRSRLSCQARILGPVTIQVSPSEV
jgi:ferredoxin